MEELLHYVWKHKLFPLGEMRTTRGNLIEVINPGLHNQGSGPDFFNAKIKIDGQLWVGNVEIHVRASDWFRHHHDVDDAYSNVILHVVGISDADVPYPNKSGKIIPQLQLDVPEYVTTNYDALSRNDQFPRCRDVVLSFPRLTVHAWLSALQVERLEERSTQIKERWVRHGKNWEETSFVTISRNFGFGKNGDAFERWANSFPLMSLGKHRDSLFQIEAVFFGQAGMLEEPHDEFGDYYVRLRQEYNFLRHKFSLKPIESTAFRFMRLRPENFPQIRLAQLAMLYFKGGMNLANLLSCADMQALYHLFDTSVSDYWKRHFTFKAEESAEADKRLSKASIDLIAVNSVVPLLFAYGRYKGDEALCDRAFNLMEEIKAENNKYIRDWKNAGVTCTSAADSQALMQLSTKYCEPRNCLRCRFGFEYIRKNPDFLAKESEEKDGERE